MGAVCAVRARSRFRFGVNHEQVIVRWWVVLLFLTFGCAHTGEVEYLSAVENRGKPSSAMAWKERSPIVGGRTIFRSMTPDSRESSGIRDPEHRIEVYGRSMGIRCASSIRRFRSRVAAIASREEMKTRFSGSMKLERLRTIPN